MYLLFAKSIAETVTAMMRTQTRVEEQGILGFWLERIIVDLLQDKVYIINISQFSSTKIMPIN